MLSKAQFGAGAKVRLKEVVVPELGTVTIRSLPSKERDAWEASVVGQGQRQNLTNLRARLVVKALCDEAGNRWYEDADAEQVGQLDSAVIDFLFEQIRLHSRMRKEDVEAVEKNSASGPSAASGSA